MCCVTKRKIADCVKELVHGKEIRKITIQDIMNKTNMSRQSFYYHFQDIYDVLEWIILNDVIAEADCEENDLEGWILELIHAMQNDWVFYKKAVRQIPWPTILSHVKCSVEEKVGKLFCSYDSEYCIRHPEEFRRGIQFFSASLCYYLMDLVHQNRKLSDDEIIQELHFLISLWKGFQCMGEHRESDEHGVRSA